MTAISSSTLFHFTSSVDNLVSILTNEFRLHYAFDDWRDIVGSLKSSVWGYALPMVCFCDIPLSQASSHMMTYGSYGIGLTKEWGKLNGVSPVLYTHARSNATTGIYNLLELQLPDTLAGTAIEKNFDTCFAHLIGIAKPYEGPFIRRGSVTVNVRFYDEREWRWLPPNISTEMRILTHEEYIDFSSLAAANTEVADGPKLSFKPSDIRYIIVSTEAEILPMIRAIERIKAKYSEDQVKLLSSRILSAEAIAKDM